MIRQKYQLKSSFVVLPLSFLVKTDFVICGIAVPSIYKVKVFLRKYFFVKSKKNVLPKQKGLYFFMIKIKRKHLLPSVI